MKMNPKKHTFLLLFTVLMLLCSAVGVSAADLNEKWVDHRGNANHNAVVNVKLPTTAAETTLYWATSADPLAGTTSTPNWSYAPSHPILIEDTVVFFANDVIYKMDAVTGEIFQSGQLDAKSSWNITPPGYGDGLIFAVQENGRVQAVDYETLKVKWSYQEKELRGQSNCPTIYGSINGKGYVYTGFWNAPSGDAYYVCLDAQTGKEVWKFKNKGGFYWAGSYVCKDYLLIGSDDGQGDSFGNAADKTNPDTKQGQIYSLNPVTGEKIDEFEVPGDIRCTVCMDNGVAYFTTTSGYFYGVTVNADGTFNHDKYLEINLTPYLRKQGILASDEISKSTGTPVVYNGRAYVGTCAPNQYGKNQKGHGIAVLDLEKGEVAYHVRTAGAVQTSGLLTTGNYDDYAYVYFIENYQPGKVRVIKDKPGQTAYEAVGGYEVTDGTYDTSFADILFTPASSQEQYCIASLVCDTEYGTMYFKNDSGYIMCLGSNIEKIEIVKQPTRTEYEAGETFDPSGMQVIATYANGKTRDVTKYVTYKTDALSESDVSITVSFDHVMYRDVDDGEKGNDTNKTGVPVNALYADPISINVEKNPATDVIKAIDALDGCITKDGVAAAENAYNALDDKHKAMVTNYDELKAAKATVSKALPFTDIPDAWYQNAVQFAYYNGLMNGTNAAGTTFEPNEPTTRAQLVTILYRYAGSPAVSGATPFTDLDASQKWYQDAVKWAYQNKIVNGITSTTFGPDEKITRQQLVTILYRYCGDYLGRDVTARAGLSSFSDAKSVESYALAPFQWAVKMGYVNGVTSTTLEPFGNATRAQISTIMMRFAESMNK